MGVRLKRLLSFAFVGILFCGTLARSEFNPKIRDARQFIFGFEPTRTNLPILLETSGAIIKKIVTGKGEGVLSADLPVSTKYRDRFLKVMREECPLCKITEARESHGELSFHIEFPGDDFYIRSSLDAGALEWQTKPSSIPEIRDRVPLLQEHIFDRAKKIGVNLTFEGLGGHTTFSGFGGDTFWYGNYLKFRTHHTELDWGFFGKDGYNATPVQLWSKEQQIQYSAVHREHDLRWEKFLKKLENGLDRHVPDGELIKIYKGKDVFTQDEYAAKLLEIYHNPKLENKWLGKRSKPKYVANKPLRNLIENRAIRPQKNAEELLKMAEFMEAEAWFVKEQMNQGREVPFLRGAYAEKSKKNIVRSVKQMVKDLGLDWDRYLPFSKKGDVKLTGEEKSLVDDFAKKEYGAKKRDVLYKRLRDHFIFKQEPLTASEQVFFTDLLNEMSYTVPQSVDNAKILSHKITPETIAKLSPEEANAVIKNLIQFDEKFPKASAEILRPVQDHLLAYVKRSANEETLNLSRSVLPLMDDQSMGVVLKQAEKFPPHVYSEMMLHGQAGEGHLKKYLESISSKYKLNQSKVLPARFNEVVFKAARFEKLSPLAHEATDAVANWVASRSDALKVTESDAGLLKYLADAKPELQKEILNPLRNHYWQTITENEFGLKNFYKASATFDFLSEITPLEGKPAFLNEMLTKVKAMHKIKNDSDSAAFIERVERHISRLNGVKVGGSGGCLSWIKTLFKR